MSVRFDHVHKHFSGLAVVDDFDCILTAGELTALVGPSGCGKSTLLQMLAGLDAPDAGSIHVDGKPVTGPNPSRMLMFQEHALYPWLNLRDNVALALQLQKVPKRRARECAGQWLRTMQLDDFADYYPHQVSGGMRQRAALARAFITHPNVLLLDEPFGALDALTRMTLQEELRKLIEQTHPTVLLVTHDVDEALYLADRVLVLSSRPTRILQEIRLPKGAHSHDLSTVAAERNRILTLLGIATGAPPAATPSHSPATEALS